MSRTKERAALVAVLVGLALGACLAVALTYVVLGYAVPWVLYQAVSAGSVWTWSALAVGSVIFVLAAVRSELRYRELMRAASCRPANRSVVAHRRPRVVIAKRPEDFGPFVVEDNL